MRNFAHAGETNNRLTLIRLVEKRPGTNYWLAQCSCGGNNHC